MSRPNIPSTRRYLVLGVLAILFAAVLVAPFLWWFSLAVLEGRSGEAGFWFLWGVVPWLMVCGAVAIYLWRRWRRMRQEFRE